MEAKRPGQPKPGQGREAGLAGRAGGASLDRASLVRQLSSRRSWQGSVAIPRTRVFASHLLAVIEPINDAVIAVMQGAAAYSCVQSCCSAVAQYMPTLPDCVRGQDARRPDSGFAQKRPSRTASCHGRACPAPLFGDRRDREGLAMAPQQVAPPFRLSEVVLRSGQRGGAPLGSRRPNTKATAHRDRIRSAPSIR